MSWNKIIFSGSNAYLNSLNVGTFISASEFSGSFYGDGSNLTGISAGIYSSDGEISSVRNVTITGSSLTFTFGTTATTALYIEDATIADNSYIEMYATNEDIYFGIYSTGIDIGSSNVGIYLGLDTITVVDSGDGLGFQYDDEYTDILTNDRSIPDVGLVNQLITSNGASGSIYGMNGEISSSREVVIGQNQALTFIYKTTGTPGLYMEDDTVGLIEMYDATGTTYFGVRHVGIDMEVGNIQFQIGTDEIFVYDSGNGYGIQYGDDYSSDIIGNERSIPDVGTIRNMLSGSAVPTASYAEKLVPSLYILSASAYTIQQQNINHTIKVDSGSGTVVITVPSSSAINVTGEDYVNIYQWNAAQVLFTTSSNSITLKSALTYTTRTTGSAVSLINLGGDDWLLTGDLEAPA